MVSYVGDMRPCIYTLFRDLKKPSNIITIDSIRYDSMDFVDKLDKVSVIIPSYNRFEFLVNAVESVQAQTYSNVEIIVVDDASTDPRYNTYDFGPDVTVIHLPQNSKSIYGFGCPAHVRNEGILNATGKYVAFLDDDDLWFPKKLEWQLEALKWTPGCEMCCSDGLIGMGPYQWGAPYRRYNAEHNWLTLQNIYRSRGRTDLDREFPRVWTAEFLSVHNCCVTSSVVVARHLLQRVGYMACTDFAEDYDCWLKILKHTNCIYVEEPCFYYDLGHGHGSNWGKK